MQFTDQQGTKESVSNIKAESSRSIPSSTSEHMQCKHFKPSSVNTKFLDVKNQLQHTLQSYDTKAMLEQCENLLASDINNIPLFSSDHLLELKQCNRAPTFIEKLSPNCNWSNHSILAAVISACENHDATTLLEQFDSQIDSSLPATDYPIPQPHPNMVPFDNSTHTVMAVKLNAELSNFSLQNLLDKCALLQNKLQATANAFQLLAMMRSPTIIYWMIPKCIVAMIASNITQQSCYLFENGIVELSVYPGSLFTTCSSLQVGSLTFFTQFDHLVRLCICKYFVITILFVFCIVSKI